MYGQSSEIGDKKKLNRGPECIGPNDFELKKKFIEEDEDLFKKKKRLYENSMVNS